MIVHTHKVMPPSSVIKPELEQQTHLQKPAMYRVLLRNDNYTPMDFVVEILRQFFFKKEEESVQLMLQIHQKGQACCGIYSYEVAQQKVHQVNSYSQQHQHPLQCIMEKDSD